jgi:hypothetical protein
MPQGCDAVPEPNIPGEIESRDGYILWPPRSHNLTPMGFSFWGFMKDNVYIPSMLTDLKDLRDRIVNATALVDVTFLRNCGTN